MSMNGRPSGLLRALGSLIASGALLGSPSASQSIGPPRQVAVAAAADLKFAMDEILKDFRSVRPDLEVRVTYGSSGNFFAQLSRGAPFDLFFAADIAYVRQLRSRKLTLPQSEFTYATGRIVLWVPRSSLLDLNQGLAALRTPSVRRIAIANPRHAPYGRAAEAAMKSMKIYDAVRSKLVFGENVAQTAHFVQSGAADAGIIALGLASSPAMMREGRYWEIPVGTYPPIEQGGAILRNTRNPQAARALIAFVLGPHGRAVLKRFGFSLPKT